MLQTRSVIFASVAGSNLRTTKARVTGDPIRRISGSSIEADVFLVSAALDDVLADYLAWEHQEYSETVAAVSEAHGDVRAGRTRPGGEFFTEVRAKYCFSR